MNTISPLLYSLYDVKSLLEFKNIWKFKDYYEKENVKQLRDVNYCLMCRSVTYYQSMIPENK